MRALRVLSLPTLLLLALSVSACADASPESVLAPDLERALSHEVGHPLESNAETDGSALATLRRVTAKYHDVEAALADGFMAIPECVSVPGLGGMGYHYVSGAAINDGEIDWENPDVLLYEPTRNGKLRLVGVELVIWRADWTEADAPTFMGTPFAASFGGLAHGLPDHYEMHVWVWKHNPAGMLAPFNPDVSCG